MTALHFSLAALLLLMAAAWVLVSDRVESPRLRLAASITVLLFIALLGLMGVLAIGIGPRMQDA